MSKANKEKGAFDHRSKPKKERKFGGLDHWFGDPSGVEELLESGQKDTNGERSELLAGYRVLKVKVLVVSTV